MMHQYINLVRYRNKLSHGCTISLLALSAASVLGGCGLIDGIQGPGSEPSGARLSQLAWHGPVQVPLGGAVEADAPSQVWAQGAAWLAFSAWNNATGSNSVWLTRRARGGDFVAPVQILDESASGWDGGAAYPSMNAGESGDATVVALEWVVNSNFIVTDSSLWAGHYDATLTNTGFDTMVPGSNLPTAQDFSANGAASDDVGNTAVGYGVMGSGNGLYLSTQPEGRGWSNAASVDPNLGLGGGIVLAGASGQGLLVWGDDTGASQSGSTYAFYGAPFDTAATAASPGGSTSLGTVLNASYTAAMRGDHAMVLLASESASTLVSYAWANGAFSQPTSLPSGAVLPYYVSPEVAVDSRGDAVAIWREPATGSNDGYGGTLMGSYWDGGSWSPKSRLDVGNPNPKVWWGQVAMNDDGEAVAAWADFDPTGVYTRIYANVLDTSSGAPVWGGAVAVDAPSPDAGLADHPENVRYVNVSLDRDGGTAQVAWIQHPADGGAATETWANWVGP